MIANAENKREEERQTDCSSEDGLMRTLRTVLEWTCKHTHSLYVPAVKRNRFSIN